MDTGGAGRAVAIVFRIVLAALPWQVNLPCLATNISCAGDSITYGSGLSRSDTYPAKLQNLLGSGFRVGNFGISGRTMLKEGDLPYWDSTAYADSCSNPSPDVVVIMLGTNDSKPRNWTPHGTNFVADYEAMIAAYANLPTAPRILVCTPPPAFTNGLYDIDSGVVATQIVPLVRGVAASNNLEIVDLYSVFEEHAELFRDKVHPNPQGTSVMAAAIYSVLMGSTNGCAPRLEINPQAEGAVVLEFPAESGGYVLQSTAELGTSNSWSVVGQPLVRNGSVLQSTNPIVEPSEVFRLWNPSD